MCLQDAQQTRMHLFVHSIGSHFQIYDKATSQIFR